MKTHKNNFPDFQSIKTFFQSFFKKTIFVLKKIISLQELTKSSVLLYSYLRNLRNFEYCVRISKNCSQECGLTYSMQWVVLKTSKADM